MGIESGMLGLPRRATFPAAGGRKTPDCPHASL